MFILWSSSTHSTCVPEQRLGPGSWGGYWGRTDEWSVAPLSGSPQLRKGDRLRNKRFHCHLSVTIYVNHTSKLTHTGTHRHKYYGRPRNDFSLWVHEFGGKFRPFRQPRRAHELEHHRSISRSRPRADAQATVHRAEPAHWAMGTRRTLCPQSQNGRRLGEVLFYTLWGKTWPNK